MDSLPESRTGRGCFAEGFVVLHLAIGVILALLLFIRMPSLASFLVGAVIAGLCILLAWGFYTRRQWARYILVLLASAYTLGTLKGLYESFTMPYERGLDAFTVVVLLLEYMIPLLLWGYVAYWLVTHDRYFRRDAGG